MFAGKRVAEFCFGYDTYLLQSEIKNRYKRSNGQFLPGRVRGQTQSQYLNFGNGNDPGRAEAEATYGGSKAVVGTQNNQTTPHLVCFKNYFSW